MTPVETISIPLQELRAPRPVKPFFAIEFMDDVRCNVSQERPAVLLNNGETVSGSFKLEKRPDPSAHYLFRFTGMWNFYRFLPPNHNDLTRYVDVSGNFRAVLNGRMLYDGRVSFWTSRRWRFWVPIELKIPAGVLREGENTFELSNLTPAFEIHRLPRNAAPDSFTDTGYQLSAIDILSFRPEEQPEQSSLPPGTFLGHMIGGHDASHVWTADFAERIDLFNAERQGNLLVFLLGPGKMDYLVDLDLIDCEQIRKNKNYVLLRYYGQDRNRFWSEEEFRRKISSFRERLGEYFLGAVPHEHFLSVLRDYIKRDLTAPEIFGLFRQEFRDTRVTPIRKLLPGTLLIDTDPSFYSQHYLKEGADMPGLETGMFNLSVNSSSMRGAARAFDKPAWAAINAFECQNFGGLQFSDREALADRDFCRKRENLWWLTQYICYLGGARIIYSESGMFDHRLGLQVGMEHPHLRKLREIQAGFVRFAEHYRLEGQPAARIAFLQGENELYWGGRFTGQFMKKTKNAVASWSLLRVCYPGAVELDFSGPDRIGESRFDRSNPVSDTPFGEADILPVCASLDVMRCYQVIVLAGNCDIDETMREKLTAFVAGGGVLFGSLAQFDGPDGKELLRKLLPGEREDGPLLEAVSGKGRVVLGNFPHFPERLEAYGPLSRAIRETLEKLPAEVKLPEDCRNVNFFCYPAENGGGRVFFLRNDWYGNDKPLRTEVEIRGEKRTIELERNKVLVLEY